MQAVEHINGHTEVFGVIGDPIEHTLSPVIHNTMAKMCGQNMVYTALHVSSEGLEAAVKGAYELEIKGFNVTVPHKKAIMPYLCKIDKTAEAVGAVNTVKYTDKGYVGYNTDMIGAYYALVNNGVSVEDKTVLILGAGGAANACTAMAAANKAKKIYIANRTLQKAAELAEHIKAHYSADVEAIAMSDIYDVSACDIVLNATTLGFGDKKDMTPIENISFFKEKGVKTVFDAIYSPWTTRLLYDADSQGVQIINGFDMLIYQAVAAEEIWFNKSYDNDTKASIRQAVLEYYSERN